ncbi:MAG: hypothetical protein Terrestrivirus2_137 [Terrestrivirus sp.]|uniref:Uncharacterized protein n=1 Tax=Terrestrivirus sp. TaxID=2487775 RepID=A0A3G4ZQB0_9VIRU|nr:MAG: hypothetical protein Terrestrivirus2_137 [Terrestrivirus sp.]
MIIILCYYYIEHNYHVIIKYCHNIINSNFNCFIFCLIYLIFCHIIDIFRNMKNLSNNSTRMYEYDPEINNEEVLFIKADITSLIIICIIIYVVIYYIFVYKLYVFDQNIKTTSEMNKNNEYNMYLNSADVLLVVLILYGMYRINLLDIDITSKAFYYILLLAVPVIMIFPVVHLYNTMTHYVIKNTGITGMSYLDYVPFSTILVMQQQTR